MRCSLAVAISIRSRWALKLKEISYIHAEAYAAGELKHGPLALIDAEMPVIVVAPNNELLEKLKSNIEEVRARAAMSSPMAMRVLQQRQYAHHRDAAC
jgi:glucosamine 6-phosphate synthetase-like amidotransferase/phosphosugar isomerase protein